MTTLELTEAETAELARWQFGKLSMSEWLDRPADKLQASLVRLLDRPNRGGVLALVVARKLDADLDALFAEHHPRKAAQLAADCRERGDQPHADKLHAALVALMFCANCGRPLNDPLSIDRGIGPDCWQIIDAPWRAAIDERLSPGARWQQAHAGNRH